MLVIVNNRIESMSFETQEKPNKPKTVFGYLNYRQYLKGVYQLKKRRTAGFSYRIFSQKTGYDKLDQQLVLTMKKKNALLLVLTYEGLSS